MEHIKYRRFTSEQKALIKNLTLEGKSLNYLSKLMGAGKPTIYYQVRKFKPRIKKNFDPSKLNDFEIGELIGAFAGDGNFYRNPRLKEYSYKIRYSLSAITDRSYVDYIANLLKRSSLNPMIWTNNEEHVTILAIKSKEFYFFIKNYLEWEKDKTLSIRLKKPIGDYSEEFLRGFARGLMDTDGFTNGCNVVCACISQRLIDNLAEIFTKFGIENNRTIVQRTGNSRDLFFVRVIKKGLEEYFKEIGFSNQYKGEVLIKNLNKMGMRGFEPRSRSD